MFLRRHYSFTRMFKSILFLFLAGSFYSPVRAFYKSPLPLSAPVTESHFPQHKAYDDGATKIIDLILDGVGLQAG